MKCLPCEMISTTDKQLILKMVVLVNLSFVACSNLKSRGHRITPIKLSNISKDDFSNFDQVHISNKPPVIAKMISVLKPNFSASQRNDIAFKIHQAFDKYKIEPQIVVAIIDTESSFNHNLVSSTGDLSLAQVNVEVWNKEFERMNLEIIDIDKLKADKTYSLEVMAKILHILKTRYEKKDRHWYARYHSKTMKHKKEYLAKLEYRMKKLEQSQVVAMN